MCEQPLGTSGAGLQVAIFEWLFFTALEGSRLFLRESKNITNREASQEFISI
jgi:hypothetical protein